MLMISLVGYTGFVGSNIYAKAGNKIDKVYNTKNINEAYGTKPDLLIYSGLRAEKYLANNEPYKDMELIIEAQENIKRIAPKRLVLISTIDVYKNPVGVDENSPMVFATNAGGLHPYGLNRYYLESWARKNYKDALIIRLPGLYGKNIKKNFIYDYINVIPFMLNRQKFDELTWKEAEYGSSAPLLKECYELLPNGFYKCNITDEKIKQQLKIKFKKLGFTALNFTDSRSKYQFYPLSRLWQDIQTALDNDLKMFNPATEPVTAAEVYRYLTGDEFVNELNANVAEYDYRTVYAELFGGKNGYICSKEQILEDIKHFTEEI